MLKISDSREIDSNDLFQDLITYNRQSSCESRSSVRSTTYVTRSKTSKSTRGSCYIVYTGYHLKIHTRLVIIQIKFSLLSLLTLSVSILIIAPATLHFALSLSGLDIRATRKYSRLHSNRIITLST